MRAPAPMLVTILAAFALAPAPGSAAAEAGATAAAIAAMRTGDMTKLVVHPAPKPAIDGSFTDPDGGSHSLSDYRGKVVVLNFWATWCAPCREEMPSLDRLQAGMGGADLAVVTLATGRNSPQGISRFFEEEGLTVLPRYADSDMALARSMAVLGLPVTVILNRDGQEVARLTGGADWNGADARAILSALTGADGLQDGAATFPTKSLSDSFPD